MACITILHLDEAHIWPVAMGVNLEKCWNREFRLWSDGPDVPRAQLFLLLCQSPPSWIQSTHLLLCKVSQLSSANFIKLNCLVLQWHRWSAVMLNVMRRADRTVWRRYLSKFFRFKQNAWSGPTHKAFCLSSWVVIWTRGEIQIHLKQLWVHQFKHSSWICHISNFCYASIIFFILTSYIWTISRKWNTISR